MILLHQMQNRGDISDLPLLRALLAIRQKSCGPSFWEVMNSFVFYGSITSSWKPWRWVRLDLILTMRNIYINSNLTPKTKLTSASRSTEFKDILLKMITKTVAISTRIVISYGMKQGIPLWIWWKVNGNWDNMITIFQWKESHCRTNTTVRR